MMNHDQFADELQLFALGELDDARAAEFREHMEGCAACRREFEQMQADAALLALSVTGSKPPARSREALMAAIAKEPRVTRMVQRRQRWWALAPLFAAAAVAVFAIMLWVENNSLRDELSLAQSQSAEMRREMAKAREIVSTMTASDAVHITLVAAKAKPQPQGRVIYLKRNGNLMFFASNLNPLPERKTYELWLIPTSGKAPIPAGTFKPDSRGTAQLMLSQVEGNPDAKTFAITVENEGGSNTPTMPIVMIGE
jgi:anti-sigma-K factor RskA